MAASDPIRWGELAAMLGGVAWVVDSLLVLAVPEAGWTNVVFIVAVLFVLAGLVGLHALQGDDYGRVGRGGFWTVIAASLAQVLGLVVFLAGSEALLRLVFPVGTLAALVGFVLYGAATLQAKVLPRWCGVGLIVAPLLTVLLGDYGGILFGLFWLALGYVLWSWRETPARRPSRAG